MQNELCECGSEISVGYTFCQACGSLVERGPSRVAAPTRSVEDGPTMDPSFEGDDAPTRVSDPDFLRERVRVERVGNVRPPVRTARPIAPWVPMAAPSAPVETAPEPPPRREGGFQKGLLIGFGVAGFLFGILSIGVAAIAVVTGGFSASPFGAVASRPAPVRAVAARAAAVPDSTPVVVARVEPVATSVFVKVEPTATPAPREIAVAPTPAPTPEKVARVAAPVVAPRVVAAAPVATPRVVAATPAPRVVATPAPAAKPTHNELAMLAASAIMSAPAVAPAPATVSTPQAASSSFFAAPTPAPAPARRVAAASTSAASAWPRVEATPAPAPARWTPDETVDAAPAASSDSPASATPDPELADLLGAPAMPVATPAPRKAAPAAAKATVAARSADSSERVIHSRKGDKPVFVNANIALTKVDGKTLVGKLVDVDGGFVDVKTGDAQLRIAETDVMDAATY